MGRNQKQIEQIRMAMNKIKFIERSLKYDIRAKLRVAKFTLEVQLESYPQFNPCIACNGKGSHTEYFMCIFDSL